MIKYHKKIRCFNYKLKSWIQGESNQEIIYFFAKTKSAISMIYQLYNQAKMISEKQINPNFFKSNLQTKINVEQVHTDSSTSTQIGKMKTAFHQKIRNRELDKIKAQKRKLHQIHIAIQNILQSDFPKESNHAKNWANQLTQLYKQTPKYETDPHKLREIFCLAQRFPSLGTLRLFYFAVLTTQSKNIRTLADVDVWTFLHNILKDSTKTTIAARNLLPNGQNISFSSALLTPAIDETELKMVKLVIETFIVLFDKDIKMRDYSIGVHSTYTGYIVQAYRKFKDKIRTQMIYFLMAALREPPRQYKRDYLNVIRLAIGMINEYNLKTKRFMQTKEWVAEEMMETIQEAISRVRNLFGVLSKAFEHASCKWLNEFLDKKNATIIFNYYENTYEFLTFGMWILGELILSKEYNREFYDTFGKTMEMIHNLFLFFMVMSEKTYQTEPSDGVLIKGILGKVVLMLNFIKNCEENKVFIYAEKDLLMEIEKTKQICLFSIDNGLNSEFDTYQNFARNFIFYNDQENNSINLLEVLIYYLKTVHSDLVMSDLIRVFFTLLRIEVSGSQLERFSCLSMLLEQIIQMMEDKVVTGTTKANIVNFLCEYFCVKQNKRSIGSGLGVENILLRNIRKFEDFMYSKSCTQELFESLENLMHFTQDLQKRQYNN